MRWKLLRNRYSISAPRVIVRSFLPWPLRCLVFALTLGFSAAFSLWAFELGKEIAGLRPVASGDAELATLRAERDKAQSIANTAESLLKLERVAQERLLQQLKQVEAENLAIKADLGFFEKLLPAAGAGKLAVRGLQAESVAEGQLRYQLLLMQAGKSAPEFNGQYDLTLSGLMDGKQWSLPAAGGPRPLQLRQFLRIEGILEHPPDAQVTSIHVRVMDSHGGVRARQTVKL